MLGTVFEALLKGNLPVKIVKRCSQLTEQLNNWRMIIIQPQTVSCGIFYYCSQTLLACKLTNFLRTGGSLKIFRKKQYEPSTSHTRQKNALLSKLVLESGIDDEYEDIQTHLHTQHTSGSNFFSSLLANVLFSELST